MTRTRRRHRPWTRTALLAPVLAALAMPGCGRGAGTIAEASPGVSPAVRTGEFRQVFLLTGELDAVVAHPVLVPRLPSWNARIRWLVDDGAEVAAGDRVAELDSSELAVTLEDKRIALDGARNELLAKRAELDGAIAEKRHARDKAEIARRRAEIAAAVPAEIQPYRTWQEAQLALARANTAVDKAAAELAAAESAAAADLRVQEVAVEKAAREVADVERAIDTMVLRAPRAGIVVVAENRREGRKFQIGDDAWVGLELLRVPELDRMRVRAALSDVDDGRIHPGQRATCTLDTYPERAFACAVAGIGPVAQEAGWRSTRRTFAVDVDLDAADPELMRPGMSVQVEVETDRRPEARLVSRAALRFEDDGTVILADGAGGRPVVLGPCNVADCVVDESGAIEPSAAGGGRP